MIKNITLGLLVMVLVVGMAGAPAVRAQTTADQAAQISALLAQIAALQAQLNAGAMAHVTFTRNLTVGSTGADVMALQQWLNKNGCPVALSGVGSVGLESSFFGAKTKAAVACWQAAHNISPAVGYFGPVTRAAVNAMVVVTPPVVVPPVTTTTTPTTTPVLTGGAGSVDQYTLVSSLNNEQVGEGTNDVKVAGLKIENSNGSDIMINAVRLVFTQGSATRDFRKYADEVSIWIGGKEYARVPASDFTSDNDFSQTLSLKSGAIIKAGQDGEIDVAVSGISNLDSGDANKTWTVDFRTVRFMDAQNAVISEDPGTSPRTFSFQTLTTAADTKLDVQQGDTSINDAHVIEVDNGSSNTNNVPLLSFDLKVEGSADVTLKDLPVFVTTTAANVDGVLSGLTLKMDGTEIGSADIGSDCLEDTDCVNVGSSETYKFAKMNQTLQGGHTYHMEVDADIFGIGSGGFVAGDTIGATFGETQTDNLSAFTVEDTNGDELADGDVNGTVTGDQNALYHIAFNFKLVSTNAVKTAGDPATTSSTDIGTFTTVYDLTAFGGPVSIDKDCLEDQSNVPDQGTEYVAENNATASCSLTSTADTNPNDANAWVLQDGQTKRFTLTVAATATNDFVRTYLASINWDDDITDTSPDQYFTFGLGQDKTSSNQLYLQTY